MQPGPLLTVASGRRVTVACEPRYRAQRQPAALAEGLRRRGWAVDDRLDTAGAGDVVVVRGRSEELLRAAELAEWRGAVVLDRPAAVRRVRDKVAMSRTLRDARLPVPVEWTGHWSHLCRDLSAHDAPLVVKPRFGDNGRDVHVVASGADLAALPWSEPTAIVQSYVPNDGADLKLYAVGSRVWAVRKASPLAGAPEVTTRPVALTPELARIASVCRLQFGLELLGIDCVRGPRGPVVLEVNDFPNYSALPDADEVLAEFVVAAARSARTAARPALVTTPGVPS